MNPTTRPHRQRFNQTSSKRQCWRGERVPWRTESEGESGRGKGRGNGAGCSDSIPVQPLASLERKDVVCCDERVCLNEHGVFVVGLPLGCDRPRSLRSHRSLTFQPCSLIHRRIRINTPAEMKALQHGLQLRDHRKRGDCKKVRSELDVDKRQAARSAWSERRSSKAWSTQNTRQTAPSLSGKEFKVISPPNLRHPTGFSFVGGSDVRAVSGSQSSDGRHHTDGRGRHD